MTEEVMICSACIACRRPNEPLEEQLGKLKAQATRDGLWQVRTTAVALINIPSYEQEHFMRWAGSVAPLTAWAIYEEFDGSETYAGWLAWDGEALQSGLEVYAQQIGQALTNVEDITPTKLN